MRVYVLGDNREHVVKLSNYINANFGTAIISERIASSYGELVDDILEYREADFDLIVIVSKQPIETSIEANRSGKLMAAVCRNPKEATMAKKASANVVVLDCNGFDNEYADEIVGAWIAAGEGPKEEEHETEAPTPRLAAHTEKLKQIFSFSNVKS